MSSVMVAEVAQNIYLIDDKVCSIPKLGSVYLLNEEKKALVDCGPPSSAATVLEGIRKVGIKAEDIEYIIVTHIHLDHAGGSGILLKRMARARVLVHHRGARHLVKLAELMESSARTQGARIIAMYGKAVAVPPERVQAIYDNDTIRLGRDQVLEFIDSPGHAPHELCIFERRGRGLFVGDALGLYLANGSVLLPIHPPPSFDAEVSINTIKRLMNLDASKLYFAHFGASGRARELLQMAIDQIRSYAGMLAEAVESGTDGVADKLVSKLRPTIETLKKEPAVYKIVSEDLLPSGVMGFITYYQKHGI